MKKNFYITTPLYYVNDKPHMGTAYSTILGDIFNRYHKFLGKKTFFMTGADEHGQKCEEAAKKRGKDPKTHCDEMSVHFKEAWKALNIQYDHFFRTTDEFHKEAVSYALKKLYDKGDIYSSSYKGWYCVSEEVFYTKKDLVDGKSPTGKEVVYLEEKAWFFKMSKYKEALIRHIEENPNFILPVSRRNEALGFLKSELQDLCISRPKKRVSFGVELPFDRDCVVYVWVDALLNYVTGIGYPKDQKNFSSFWKESHHLIGKDILVTHSVYLTTLLLALELPLPRLILAHGWLLNKEGDKMSKSSGSVMDPLSLSKRVGVDALRFYLACDVILGRDADISNSLIEKRINEDLAGGIGNILSRTCKILDKNYEGSFKLLEKEPTLLKEESLNFVSSFQDLMEEFKLSEAIQKARELLSLINQELEKSAPWKMVKENPKEALIPLYSSLEALRLIALLLYPIMPSKMEELLLFLGERIDSKNLTWGRLKGLGKKITTPKPLFPRIEKREI